MNGVYNTGSNNFQLFNSPSNLFSQPAQTFSFQQRPAQQSIFSFQPQQQAQQSFSFGQNQSAPTSSLNSLLNALTGSLGSIFGGSSNTGTASIFGGNSYGGATSPAVTAPTNPVANNNSTNNILSGLFSSLFGGSSNIFGQQQPQQQPSYIFGQQQPQQPQQQPSNGFVFGQQSAPVQTQPLSIYQRGGDFGGAFSEYNGNQTHSSAYIKQGIADFSPVAASGRGTGTGLDNLVYTILNDDGVNNKASGSDVRGGAYAANALNHLFVKVAREIGADADGRFTEDEIQTVGDIVRQNYKSIFTELHGDDDGGDEWGFHLVQNDGGTSNVNLDGTNRAAINTVFDGFFHFGFPVQNGAFLNEDGNANQTVANVTNWVNEMYFSNPLAGGFGADAGGGYGRRSSGGSSSHGGGCCGR